MSGNDALSHFPVDDGFEHYITTEGDEAAGDSNLAIGSFGAASVDAYIQDKGVGNTAVGHRRWLLFPPSVEMGTGDVPGGDAPDDIDGGESLRSANAIHVLSAANFGARRDQTHPFVAYPAPGHAPYQLVFPRWSFSVPDANFSGASVSMTRDGQPVAVDLEPLEGNIGDSTLVWVYGGKDANVSQNHERPDQDVVYEVTVSGVANAPQSQYQYTVTVIDPAAAGPDHVPTAVDGPANPKVGLNQEYTVATQDFFSGIRWRVFGGAPFDDVEGAEDGLDALEVDTSPGYTPRTDAAGSVAAGSWSFHLATAALNEDQIIRLPQTIIPEDTSKLTFQSKLQFATVNQIAKVQVSLDGGISWQDVYEQPGTGGAGESSFKPVEVELAPFSERTINVRFVYEHKSGLAFTDTDPQVGWLFDEIAVSDAIAISNPQTSDHLATDAFTYSPSETGTFGLQAQGVLFEEYELEWGPVTEVSATSGSNTPPTASDDAFSFGQNAGGVSDNVLGNDTDPDDGDTLSVVTVEGDPANVGQSVALGFGSVVVMADGGFTYTLDGDNPQVQQLQPDESLEDAFVYSIEDSNGGSSDATVAITIEGQDPQEAPASRLVNISTRGQVLAGDSVMIAGFVIGGEEPMDVVVRASGPGLDTIAENLVGQTIEDPRMQVFRQLPPPDGPQPLDDVDNWGEKGDGVALADAFGLVGAFPFEPSSTDAAIEMTLQPGAYTSIVSGVGGATGLSLVEVYDKNSQDDPDRPVVLENISTRADVGAGDAIVIAGFVITGDAPLPVLVRGVGPTLESQNVPGFLEDPRIRIVDKTAAEVAANDDWEDNANAAEIVSAADRVGAFALPSGSADASLLVELDPGLYTVLVSGVGGTEGIALVEVYDASE